MRSQSILLKSAICGFAYAVFVLLLFFVIYDLDFFEGAFFIGLPCGAIIALVTDCDTAERTVIAKFMGLLSVVAVQFILEMSGVPYVILMYLFRNDGFVQEMGRLTVNEIIGYGWGRLFFRSGLILSFVVTTVGILIFDRIKGHSK